MILPKRKPMRSELSARSYKVFTKAVKTAISLTPRLICSNSVIANASPSCRNGRLSLWWRLLVPLLQLRLYFLAQRSALIPKRLLSLRTQNNQLSNSKDDSVLDPTPLPHMSSKVIVIPYIHFRKGDWFGKTDLPVCTM